jgi:hypothetical protein
MSAATFTQPPVGVPSSQAARLIRRSYHVLYDLIRTGKIAAPPIVAGRYVWRQEDIAAAEAALGVDRRRKVQRQAAGAANGAA